MQSNNPVFARSEGFNGRGQTSYARSPSSWSTGAPGQAGQAGQAPYGGQGYGGAGSTPTHDTGRMTIDSVVQKSAMTLGTVAVVAMLTWVFIGPMVDDASVATATGLSFLGSIGAFVLSLVNSFKKVISPALVLAFSVLEGIFVGAFSKVVDNVIVQNGESVVLPAVLGTFAAAGGTLAAYKFFDIQVGNKFRTWVVGAMFGFVALSLLDVVLQVFGAGFGFTGFGPMGLLASVAGLGIGILMLILDFDFVERGIAAGLPERESWRAAFGLTVTIVWIYINLLRILAILRGD